MANFLLSAFADEYDSNFIEQLKALNRFEIPYIELRHINGKNISTLNKEEILDIKKSLVEYNIRVSAIGSPLGKIKLDGDLNEHLELAKTLFEYANILETKNVRIFSFYPADGESIEEHRQDVIETLTKMLELSDSYGITLCHENEANIYGEKPENCLDILEHFNGKMKAVFDMGNFALEGYEPKSAYEMLKGHIEYFHIKDALAVGAIVPPGKGEGKIKEILDAYLAEYNKDTFVTIEPHLQTFSGLNALTSSGFDNPYKYESLQAAFADAVNKLKELLV